MQYVIVFSVAMMTMYVWIIARYLRHV